MSPGLSEAAIRDALTYIPADDRDLWVRIGMALKSECGDDGFSMFEEWSGTAENFDPKAAKASWKSFKTTGGVRLGTLVAEAKKRGFDPKKHAPAAPLSAKEKARLNRERIERERAEEAEAERKRVEAAEDARRLWSSGTESGVSEYLVRKSVQAHGVRFAGGDLLIPMIDADGEVWNLQRILADGAKRFLAGGRVSGCFHVIGSPEHSEWILIAEGYATAAALHQASGLAVVVAFNAANLKHVAKAVRMLYPAAKLLLCADDDSETEKRTGKNPGVVAARDAAKAVRSVWCKPEGLPAGGTDFNDLACASGIDAVREQISAVISGAEAAGSSADAERQKTKAADKGDSKKPPKKAGNGSGGNDNSGNRPFFHVDERGVWYHGFSQHGDPLSPLWICSPLRVTADTSDINDTGCGYLLEFEGMRGSEKRWAMPANMLAGDGTAYRSALLDMGLKIGPSAQARTLLGVYIQTQKPDKFVRCTDRIGWHDDVYVLPDRTIGEGEELVMFQSAAGSASHFKQRGSLDEWKSEVADLCRGNSRLLFCVSAAFAAPLLYHSGVASGGFHIWGDSSSGKSTAFKVAGSVYGGKDYARNWRMTDNALEIVAAQHSDALLLLDEIAQVDPKVVGDTVYMLANESGKGRATQGAAARRTYTWRVLFLSDGEVSLANHMSEAGKGTRGGHDVRLAHIAADAGKGFGVYEDLHDFADGAALSNHLVRMSQQYYGAAGVAFIEWAVSKAMDGTLSQGLRSRVERLTREMCPEGAHGQVSRVASRFALVGVAGELATGAGITGWAQGEAVAAACACFEAWLEGRGGAGNTEHTAILRQVSGFFQAHGDSRFVWWHRALDDRKPNAVNRAGFKRLLKGGEEVNSDADHHKEFGEAVHPDDFGDAEVEYFVLPEVFRNEICKGFNPKTVARLLIDCGFLVPGGTQEKPRSDRRERLPGIGMATCYRFKPAVVAAETGAR